ncbi:MAG: Fe-S cluster assembly protein SufD [Crocinitomicaceae bacterium]|nr:Fe-S cluster assembly protein SufD [Crocinitomicaceae bacterium]
MAESKIEKFAQNIIPPQGQNQTEAWEKFLASEFPTTRDEYWKYTRVGKIANGNYKNVDRVEDHINITDDIVCKDYLVVVNGVIREDLSQYTKTKFKVEFESAETAELNDGLDVFGWLNNATINRKISIKLGKGERTDGPLQLIFVGYGKNILQSSLVDVEVGDNAEGELVFSYLGRNSEEVFTNFYSRMHVGKNASLSVNKFQLEEGSTSHVSNDNIVQENSSRFTINTNTLYGQLVRNNLNIRVTSENCETNLNGIVMGHGNNHVDNHTFVSHDKSHCVSNENYKYVMDDKSTGVFNGRVIVQKDAQQINAFQSNGNILLSDTASINAKPELEIYADDVKCSHGSTTGQLDENAIFYLQTRGISKRNAEKMLVAAFIAEVIEEYENEDVRSYLFRQFEQRFGWVL